LGKLLPSPVLQRTSDQQAAGAGDALLKFFIQTVDPGAFFIRLRSPDPGQQVEFIIAMGNWMMFSLLFRNLHISLAEGLMIWPPDGLASPAAGWAIDIRTRC
jgi:hypothetical protein